MTKITPSIPAQRMRELQIRPWTDAEVEAALARLDDTGMRLLCSYGSAECAGFERSAWVVRVAGLTVPVPALAEHYQLTDDDARGSASRRRHFLWDAILLAASSSPVTEGRIARMAPQLAPVDRRLFASADAAQELMATEMRSLRSKGFLAPVRMAEPSEAFTPTDSGRIKVYRDIQPCWSKLAASRFATRPCHGGRDG